MHSARKGRPPREPEARARGDDLLEAAVVDTDRIQVWRFSSAGSTWNYAGSYDPAVVRHSGLTEFVRARGGGGKYRARIRRSDGTYGTSATLTIEGAPRPWTEPDGASSSSSAPTAVGGSPWAILEKFAAPLAVAAGTYIAKKLIEDKQTDPLILELLRRSGGGAVDPLELQNAIAAAEARGETRGRELGQLTVRAEAPAGGDGALGAIERGLPQLLEVVNRHLDIEEQKVRPRQLMPPAAPAAPVAPAATDRDPLETLLLSVPLAARRFLFAAAEADETPELYASMVVGKLDDMTAARLPALLERADFVDVMMRAWPAFADFRPWCQGFVVALRDATAAEDGDDDDDSSSDSSSSAAQS